MSGNIMREKYREQYGRENSTDYDLLYKNPPAEYRGAPFWGWNGILDNELMEQQIDDFEKMGFGGFHIHSRIGLKDEYLGKKFLEAVKHCHSYACEKGMQVYLYDEDKWPSGYGGGRVTEDEAYRARYLLFSPYMHQEGRYDRGLAPSNRLTENGCLTLLGVYQVELKNGKLAGYKRIAASEEAMKGKEMSEGRGEQGQLWYAYLVVTDKLPWFNNQAYVDTLNPEATGKFLETSYEPYYKILGQEFSRTVPSIFTDEPQFTKMQSLRKGDVPEEVGIPYTDRMERDFQELYKESLLGRLPEIFWNLEDGRTSCIRYRYLNLAADEFSRNYCGVLGKWCEAHNIMLTGHLMEEASLESQLRSVGDAMRSYKYFQMPGIDILADAREYTTAKQAQSVARQMGRGGTVSELYGVTNWDFDFRGHKLQGDWQAALGVSLRVPHLAWMYMGGESKRDYPAPIDGHSPWFERYSILEDYFARVGMAMARGKAVVHVAVIHPIESMFMEMGPLKETAGKRKLLEQQFQDLTRWLLFGLIDFDFLSEALLPEIGAEAADGFLRVGEMDYTTVIVPELTTIRKSTLEVLRDFESSGGEILVLGELPGYMDGQASTAPEEQLSRYTRLGYEKEKILGKLEEVRQIDILDRDGIRAERFLCQLREDQGEKWLFIAQGKEGGKKTRSVDAHQADDVHYRLRIAGNYKVLLYDALHGTIEEADTWTDGRNTYLELEIFEHDSVLLRLTGKNCEEKTKEGTAETEAAEAASVKRVKKLERYLKSETDYRLEDLGLCCSTENKEPGSRQSDGSRRGARGKNVLLLDMAEYRLDGGEWGEREEILKIDDKIREELGYRKRTDSFPQPWLFREEDVKEHLVSLRFRIDSKLEGKEVNLALEGTQDSQIFWNQVKVPFTREGAFVDTSIIQIPLGVLKSGENILECRIPFGKLTDLEWFYLLGDFGVRVWGSRASLEEMPASIGYGDISCQGFPFYGGNIIYEEELVLPEGAAELEIGEYSGALVEASLDGEKPHWVFGEPYIIPLGEVKEGKHHLSVRCFGNRFNTFGQLHNCSTSETYFGPKTWRTQGKEWCYEYRLKPFGILKAPRIFVYDK